MDGIAAGPSVSDMTYQDCVALTNGTAYAGTDQFSVAEYALVAWLDCGSYANTYAYIQKEIATANAGGLESNGSITISGKLANVNGSNSAWTTCATAATAGVEITSVASPSTSIASCHC